MKAPTNGAQSASSTISSVVDIMQGPAASGFAVSQKLALETARFWARRMRAYADQMEMLSRCSSPNQLVTVQAQFIERLQEDIAEETAAFTQIWQSAPRDAANQSADH